MVKSFGGGSGIVAHLELKVCRIYGDISQSCSTEHYDTCTRYKRGQMLRPLIFLFLRHYSVSRRIGLSACLNSAAVGADKKNAFRKPRCRAPFIYYNYLESTSANNIMPSEYYSSLTRSVASCCTVATSRVPEYLCSALVLGIAYQSTNQLTKQQMKQKVAIMSENGKSWRQW